MGDREKFIEGLEGLKQRLLLQKDILGYGYHVDEINDVLAMLKKQEGVEPIKPTIADHPWWRCGNCGGDIGTEMHRFCPWCGRKVKWE